jgi:hypothetical protein
MAKQVPFSYSVETTPDLAGNERRQVSIRTQADSWFIVKSLVGISNVVLPIGSFARGSFNVLISDEGSGRNWASSAVNQNNVVGTVLFPHVLREPIVLAPNTLITLDLTNLLPVANAVQIVMDGFKHFDLAHPPMPEQVVPPANRRKRWFQYIVDKTVAANNRDTAQLKIQSDSWFYAQEVTAT